MHNVLHCLWHINMILRGCMCRPTATETPSGSVPLRPPSLPPFYPVNRSSHVCIPAAETSEASVQVLVRDVQTQLLTGLFKVWLGLIYSTQPLGAYTVVPCLPEVYVCVCVCVFLSSVCPCLPVWLLFRCLIVSVCCWVVYSTVTVSL